MSSQSRRQLERRKTRIVCISDTHGASPKDGAFKLPKGDVLIHAGDLTNQGSLSEIKKTVAWLAEAEIEVKIVIAGNHDLTLDAPFAAAHHNPSLSAQARALVLSEPSLTYLSHGFATIRLTSPTGPHTTFRVFGSPYSPTRGQYAFSYPPCPSGAHLSPLRASFPEETGDDARQAERLWAVIPLDTDVLVTHTPLYGILDQSPKWGVAGCPALRRRVWEVRPALVICGHVHEGRGAEVVRWGMDVARPGEVVGAREWVDPATGGTGEGAKRKGRQKKLSLFDLSARAGRRGLHGPLLNDFCTVRELHGSGGADARCGCGGVHTNHYSFSTTLSGREGTKRGSLHHDVVSCFKGREGRRETAVVNAAIMARSHGFGAKKFNQPIVVDIDLPVWHEDETLDDGSGEIGLGHEQRVSEQSQTSSDGRGRTRRGSDNEYVRETEMESEESIVQEWMASDVVKMP